MYVWMCTRMKEKMRMYVCMDVYKDKRKDENEWIDELQLVKY